MGKSHLLPSPLPAQPRLDHHPRPCRRSTPPGRTTPLRKRESRETANPARTHQPAEDGREAVPTRGPPRVRRCGGTPAASHAPLSHTANDRHGSKRFARLLSSVPFLNETLGDVHFFRPDTAGSRGPEGGIQTGQRHSRTSVPPTPP